MIRSKRRAESASNTLDKTSADREAVCLLLNGDSTVQRTPFDRYEELDRVLSRYLIISSICMILMPLAHCKAQDAGSQRYEVRVRSQVALDILRGPQQQDHPGTSDDIVFDNSVWLAQCTARRGCTVTFETDGPFQHTVHANQKRDAAIEFRRVFASFGGGWTIDRAADQTDYQAGDDQASIQVSSRRTGLAFLLMRIRFITGDARTLAGGRYRMTVIGTITEN